jgi:hypothetical protein
VSESEEKKMTNAEIIMGESLELAKQGILATAPGTFVDEDGEEVEMEIPEEIHTFDGWKKLGYIVKYGEHAIAKFAIWSPTKASRKEIAEAKKNGEKPKMKMYMRFAAWFKRDQVETVAEAEKHKAEREKAKKAEKKKDARKKYEEAFDKACAKVQAENEAERAKTAEKPKTETKPKTKAKAKPSTATKKAEEPKKTKNKTKKTTTTSKKTVSEPKMNKTAVAAKTVNVGEQYTFC